jgi:hypothetical protein
MRNYPKCCDCGKRTGDYYAKRCHKCHYKYLKKIHFNILDGRTLQEYECIDCNKKISINSAIYGNGRCCHCEQLRRIKEHIGMIGRKGKKHPRFGIPNHGKGEYYKGIYMRSSWEVAYAKFLDINNIKWLYESDTFNLGDCTYTPDFYLPETNEFIEIKGYWHDDAKYRYNLFKIIYPKIKIKVLMQQDLIETGVLI